MPPDAVEMTQDAYEAAFAAQATGKNIAPGNDGLPAFIDLPSMSTQTQWENLRARRNSLLAKTDALVMRHRDQKEAGGQTKITDQSYTLLQATRQVLRDLPATVTDPAAAAWPDLSAWVME